MRRDDTVEEGRHKWRLRSEVMAGRSTALHRSLPSLASPAARHRAQRSSSRLSARHRAPALVILPQRLSSRPSACHPSRPPLVIRHPTARHPSPPLLVILRVAEDLLLLLLLPLLLLFAVWSVLSKATPGSTAPRAMLFRLKSKCKGEKRKADPPLREG